ncbi:MULTISPECIES: CPBP family glutamic-type intramembrane protease [Auritidibacter]|nr:hypothetical protein DCC26_06290 [Auritidibacter sp. NML120779]
MLSTALLLLAFLHFLTPWLIRWVLRSNLVSIGHSRPGIVNMLYPSITIGLGVSAGAIITASSSIILPISRPPSAQVLVGVLVGVLLPLGATLFSGRSARFRRNGRAIRTAIITGFSGVAEELLWRVAAVTALHALGIPWIAALILAGGGFLLLHIPLYGPKRLPYLAAFTVLVTLLLALLGPIACMSSHLAHNAYLALTGGQRKKTATPPPTPPVSSSSW